MKAKKIKTISIPWKEMEAFSSNIPKAMKIHLQTKIKMIALKMDLK